MTDTPFAFRKLRAGGAQEMAGRAGKTELGRKVGEGRLEIRLGARYLSFGPLR